MKRTNTKIDVKALSKKYRTNVLKLISAWKKGYNDVEISRSLGLDLPTIHQIKSDIELTHRRLRLEQKKENTGLYNSKQRHIFLSPFI